MTMPMVAAHGKTYDISQSMFREYLLDWYDRHARILPWRYTLGNKANPYHVWLSEIMLQQTTVQAVIPYFVKFMDKWPCIEDLALARDEDVMKAWAGLGYYARARNLLKCARVITEQHGGKFPDSLEELLKLPGVGTYTAAAIVSIAYNVTATVIDGNVDRVVSRYFAIKTPLPYSKLEIRQKAEFLFEGDVTRPGDFAQAMMDLGRNNLHSQKPEMHDLPGRGKLPGAVTGYRRSIAV